jgi:hypothetical protein
VRTSARREAARARTQSETVSKPAAPATAKSKARTKTAAKPKAAAKPAATAKSKPAVKPKSAAAKAKPAAKPKSATAKTTARRASPKLRAPAKQDELAPKQGYEPEEEVELGNTVHPPSGGELLESIADIFGELAGAGAGAGGRLLKDALSIFRRT